MTLGKRIRSDLEAAMRARDELRRETLRMALSALENRRIELGRALGEGDELAVLAKAVKSRTDSAEQYDAAGRPELAEKERAEIALLEAYLPAQLTEDEAREIVRRTIEELGISEKKQIGQLMKTVMARHKGELDGKLVQRLAGELLS